MSSILIRWMPLIFHFLGGQAIVQIINLCTALLVLRLLPINEYSLYIIANFFLNIGSSGSDLNLSTALSCFGARLVDEQVRLSGLFSLIVSIRKKLFIVMILVIVLTTPFMIQSHDLQPVIIISLLIPILFTTWFQQKLTLRTMVLNIHHDSKSLFQSAVTGSIIRLALTYFFCSNWPHAIVAVICTLISTCTASWIAKIKCKLYIDERIKADKTQKENVKNFIYPLIPAAIYFTFQGQISIFLISIFGSSNAIAEVGALTRFGQVFSFLGILNGFLFQPAFSRINKKTDFIIKTLLVTFLLIVGFSLTLYSAWLLPDWWLLLLGKNYANMQDEVLLAVGGPIASFFYGFFFTILTARAFTQGQYWYVIATLVVQVTFISLIGIDTTHKALQLNLANSLATVIVEIILLITLIIKWKERI